MHQATEQLAADTTCRWLCRAYADQASELALTGVVDGQLVNAVIDRTFVDEDGRRWLIDYKTTAYDGSLSLEAFHAKQVDLHRAQLRAYAALLQSAYSEPVTAAIFFTSTCQLVELPADSP